MRDIQTCPSVWGPHDLSLAAFSLWSPIISSSFLPLPLLFQEIGAAFASPPHLAVLIPVSQVSDSEDPSPITVSSGRLGGSSHRQRNPSNPSHFPELPT